MVKRLRPRTIIIYGATPDSIFVTYREEGIHLIQLDSVFADTHKKAVSV